MDAELYKKETESIVKKYAFMKDELLEKNVWELLEKYDFSEHDAAVLSVCFNILSAKQTAKRMGGRVR